MNNPSGLRSIDIAQGVPAYPVGVNNPEGVCFAILQPDNTYKVLYDPHPKQLEYHQREEKNVLFYGGRGSGKSYCGRMDCHMRALAYPGLKYCILRRTYPELMKTHIAEIGYEMDVIWGGTNKHAWNGSDMLATYPNGSRGYFGHCKDESDVLKLLSSEFALMFFDEISTFDWEHVMKLAASVRTTKGSGIKGIVRAATNPLGKSAAEAIMFYETKDVDLGEYPDYNPNDWHAIKANVEDNPSVDRNEYLKQFSGLPEHIRKAWIDGDLVMEHSLFKFEPTRLVKQEDGTFQRIPYHVVEHLDLAKILKTCEIYRAIDDGWFPDPTVCLWIAHMGDRHIVIREETWYRSLVEDTAAHIKRIDKELAEIVGPDFKLKIPITYCDPTMDINTTADVKTTKELYESFGIALECSINDRAHFATVMHHALGTEVRPNLPKLQIYARGCPMLIRTIPMMSFDDKQLDRMADHKRDHHVITACYYLMSHSSDDRQASMPTASKRRWLEPKQKSKHTLGSNNVREDYKKRN